jgi:hypothetical protein
MRITSAGVVGIGTTAPTSVVGQLLDIASDNYGGMSLSSYNTGNAYAPLFFFQKSGNGTVGTHGAVADDEVLGHIQFRGSDGVEFLDAAGILGEVDGAVTGGGTDDMPGRLVFKTTADGSKTLTERMRIDSAGNVGIGSTDPANLLEIDTNGVADKGIDIMDGASTAAQLRDAAGSGAQVGILRLFTTGGTENVRLRGDTNDNWINGDLGINTSSPATLLEAEKDQNAQTLISVDNNTAGTAAIAGFQCDADAASGRLRAYSSSYTTSNYNIQDSVQLAAFNASGGLTIITDAGDINFWTGSTPAKRMVIDDNSRISLSNNDSGTSNTIFGKSAGASLDAGSNYNVFIGENVSDASMNDAVSNVGVGYSALSALTTGDSNVAIGSGAMATTTTNGKNVAIGYEAAANLVAGTDGCVAIGYQALDAAVDGAHYTIAIGQSALGALTTGAGNVAIGYQAGDALTVGQYNTAVGYLALSADDEGDSSTAIGYNALLRQNVGDETSGNTGVGKAAGLFNVTGKNNTYVGSGAGVGADGESNSQNTAVGSDALLSITSGGNNVAIGYQAGDALTTASENIAIGYAALGAADAGEGGNVVIGNEAGNAINDSSADQNVIIGISAGQGGAAAMAECVVIGKAAMNSTAGNAQTGTVAIGSNALTSLTSGARNTAVGYDAGNEVTNGGDNVFIGYQSGTENNNFSTGDYCTMVGNYTDASGVDGQNQTVIGYDATGQADNSVTLGNASVNDVYMAQDSGATVHCLDVKPTGGVLKENLLPNSGFDVWSDSTLENVATTHSEDFNSDAGLWTSNFNSADSVTTDENRSGNSLKVVNSTYAGWGLCYQSSAITVEVGKLYKISVWAHKGNSGYARVMADSASATGTGYYDTTTTTSDWHEHTFVIEATTVNLWICLGVYDADGSGSPYAYYEDIVVTEVTPAYKSGVGSKAFDGWYRMRGDTDVWRQENIDVGHASNTTYSKFGSYYSLKVDGGSTDGLVTWPLQALENSVQHYTRFRGRTVTLGAWVWCASGSKALLRILSGTGSTISSSSTHSGGSSWEWLEVTQTVPTTSTYFLASMNSGTSTTAYFSQPMLVFGSSIGEGNYTRPKGEVVWCEKYIRVIANEDPAAADDKILYLEALSSGKVPKGAKAVYLKSNIQNSLVTTNEGIMYGADSTGNSGWPLQNNPTVNDFKRSESGWVACDSNGDIYQYVTEVHSTLSDHYLDVMGVQLH